MVVAPGKSRGFSLLEVVIALAILAMHAARTCRSLSLPASASNSSWRASALAAESSSTACRRAPGSGCAKRLLPFRIRESMVALEHYSDEWEPSHMGCRSVCLQPQKNSVLSSSAVYARGVNSVS